MILATVILSIIAICSVYGSSRDVDIEENEEIPPDPETPLPPSWSNLKTFKRGAICADAAPCAVVGKYVELYHVAARSIESITAHFFLKHNPSKVKEFVCLIYQI